jgi:nuclear pore complex protein Nup133
VLGGAPRSQLPAEVIEVLANSDFYSDPHTAVLDHAAGYACLMGKSNCYVWSISALLHQDNAIPVRACSPRSILRNPS